jgi:DNA-binding CsgD family transcriptional regulator
MTDAMIAETYGISPFTVKQHLQRSFRKLGAKNRAHAVAIALRTNVIS